MGTTNRALSTRLETRLKTAQALKRNGELEAAMKAASYLHTSGLEPACIRIRRTYYRHDQLRKVESERKPLPRAERPLAAQMIVPRGVALKLHLMMLFAAHCTTAPGSKLRVSVPVESETDGRRSWRGLLAVDAVSSNGAGVQVRSSSENKRRQILKALSKLRDLDLVRFNVGQRNAYDRARLLLETGGSTAAAPISYSVPTQDTSGINVPIEFFTQGWVHLLTPSETVALLMWLDVAQNQRQEELFITAAERAGRFGLGREAYETHQALDALGLITIERPPGRHDDGRFDFDFATEGGSALCHRLTNVLDTIKQPALPIVTEVLKQAVTLNEWMRPLGRKAQRAL